MRSAISLVRNLRSPTAVAAAMHDSESPTAVAAAMHDSEIFQ